MISNRLRTSAILTVLLCLGVDGYPANQGSGDSLCPQVKDNPHVRKCGHVLDYLEGAAANPCCVWQLHMMETIQKVGDGYVVLYKNLFPGRALSTAVQRVPAFVQTSRNFQQGHLLSGYDYARHIGKREFVGTDGFDKSFDAFELVEIEGAVIGATSPRPRDSLVQASEKAEGRIPIRFPLHLKLGSSVQDVQALAGGKGVRGAFETEWPIWAKIAYKDFRPDKVHGTFIAEKLASVTLVQEAASCDEVTRVLNDAREFVAETYSFEYSESNEMLRRICPQRFTKWVGVARETNCFEHPCPALRLSSSEFEGKKFIIQLYYSNPGPVLSREEPNPSKAKPNAEEFRETKSNL